MGGSLQTLRGDSFGELYLHVLWGGNREPRERKGGEDVKAIHLLSLRSPRLSAGKEPDPRFQYLKGTDLNPTPLGVKDSKFRYYLCFTVC